MSKDQELTKKELTALCNKQEEYIKELEEKLKTPSDTEKVEEAKPDYDELCRQVQNLHYMLDEERNTNKALRWSLTMAYQEMTDWKNHSDVWEEYYYREHKRAEKLYDELEELKRKNNEN